MPHKLIVIGWLGVKHAYLDTSLENAKARYLKEHDSLPTPEEDHITEFEFDDEFCVYDAWSL